MKIRIICFVINTITLGSETHVVENSVFFYNIILKTSKIILDKFLLEGLQFAVHISNKVCNIPNYICQVCFIPPL